MLNDHWRTETGTYFEDFSCLSNNTYFLVVIVVIVVIVVVVLIVVVVVVVVVVAALHSRVDLVICIAGIAFYIDQWI